MDHGARLGTGAACVPRPARPRRTPSPLGPAPATRPWGQQSVVRPGRWARHPQSTALTTFTPRHMSLSTFEIQGTHPKGHFVKFRSERDALVDMLATAGRAIGGRGGSSPVLLGLLLTCSGNTLSVTGTDLDLTIQVTDEVIGIEDGSCVVPARLSTDIVRRLEPGAVTFADEGERSPSRPHARPSSCTPTRSWSSRPWAGRASRRPTWPKVALRSRPSARWCGPRPTTTAGRC